jgi:hypothetical protein
MNVGIFGAPYFMSVRHLPIQKSEKRVCTPALSGDSRGQLVSLLELDWLR